MIKNLVVVLVMLLALQTSAQQSTSSPYSFYGIGELTFKGTVENRTMGGISIPVDSIHINLQNPASLAKLKLTTFSVGGNQNFNSLSTEAQSENANTTSLNYLAIALPFKNVGVSFGLIPFSSVGYKTGFSNPFTADAGDKRFEGSGGLTRVYLSSAMQVAKNLMLGAELNYNFGEIEQESYQIVGADIDPYDVREYNYSRLSGLALNLGLYYSKMTAKGLEFSSGITFSPGMNIRSENRREISSVQWSGTTLQPSIRDTEEIDLGDDEITDFKLPSKLSLSAGISKPKKWFIGADITALGTGAISNRTFDNSVDGGFTNAMQYKVGGYIIPKYNSLTKYWKRVTYRFGARYENTGLVVKNEDINEFGISFGAGLPVGRLFSNMNVLLEYGSRGTKNNGLVKENFFNIGISLSFNDKWFQRRKID